MTRPLTADDRRWEAGLGGCRAAVGQGDRASGSSPVPPTPYVVETQIPRGRPPPQAQPGQCRLERGWISVGPPAPTAATEQVPSAPAVKEGHRLAELLCRPREHPGRGARLGALHTAVAVRDGPPSLLPQRVFAWVSSGLARCTRTWGDLSTVSPSLCGSEDPCPSRLWGHPPHPHTVCPVTAGLCALVCSLGSAAPGCPMLSANSCRSLSRPGRSQLSGRSLDPIPSAADTAFPGLPAAHPATPGQ